MMKLLAAEVKLCAILLGGIDKETAASKGEEELCDVIATRVVFSKR